jgi:hypothetical protein
VSAPTRRSVDLDDFFRGYGDSRRIFDALRRVIGRLQPNSMSITKSQVSFRRRKAFAWAWIPDRYLHGRHAPLVLSLALGYRNPAGRWKQVVEPAPGKFMHHLELRTPADLDVEVVEWICEAWAESG